MPAREVVEKVYILQRSWKNRIAPEGHAFPGDPRNWEQTKYKTAQLSALGEKLLGARSWE